MFALSRRALQRALNTAPSIALARPPLSRLAIARPSPPRRPISTFHMDPTPRGKLQPYLGTLKLISTVSGLVVLGIGALYLALNHHLSAEYPISSEITDRQTRKLLRGAALREHIAPSPHVAYLFLLRALELIYAEGRLSEDHPAVQEIVVRLARAAALMGERDPAEKMLWALWEKCQAQEASGGCGKEGEEAVWWREQTVRVAEVLGPLVVARDARKAVDLYGRALRAAKELAELEGLDELDEPGDLGTHAAELQRRDNLHVRQASLVASLGEAFALSGDTQSAQLLLKGLLSEIRTRNDTAAAAAALTGKVKKKADKWTCLDAVVMLDLAQVALGLGELAEARSWASDSLRVARKDEGVRACDNCQAHLIHLLGQIAMKNGDEQDALTMYRLALEFARKTQTGNIESIKSDIEKLEQ
ncbi:hypothetical protein BX661DRAFT_173411 [Kickxella alabastrina]|uniref:uncharacterized protein n=1 Tax=Kickxella alabastrina TaxID=61397 RepID=UPI00221F1A12|nr:uncharacterized protein BX661DRAFT_173411 [Kickxella alabastrina]KAI7821300.1 hypothetical protein BX661DRAFT_173411 [Kickxella alabastrina]